MRRHELGSTLFFSLAFLAGGAGGLAISAWVISNSTRTGTELDESACRCQCYCMERYEKVDWSSSSGHSVRTDTEKK